MGVCVHGYVFVVSSCVCARDTHTTIYTQGRGSKMEIPLVRSSSADGLTELREETPCSTILMYGFRIFLSVLDTSWPACLPFHLRYVPVCVSYFPS